MPIDFSDPANRTTYSGRSADPSWRAAAAGWVDATGRDVVDVGCGGGTYVRAWLELGASTVTGVDSSAPILAAAREAHGDLPGAAFVRGDAAATGLPGGSADVVFARALVHHLPSPLPLAREARRLLRPGGRLVVQDRTGADVQRPGSPDHLRGWFLELVPRLLDVELARRPDDGQVRAALREAGLTGIRALALEETRRAYPDREAYLAEVASRTGRSILHELSDPELAQLVEALRERLPAGPVQERDPWTVWVATAP